MDNREGRAQLHAVGLTEAQIERLSNIRSNAFLKECLWDEAERHRLEFARWLVSTGRLTEEVQHEQNAHSAQLPV